MKKNASEPALSWRRLWRKLVAHRRRAPRGFDVHSLAPTPQKTHSEIKERYRSGRFAEVQE